MMLALESSTNGILDRSLAKLEQRPTAATTSHKWSMRRWSLHGSDMKSPVINTSVGKSIKSPPPPPPPAQQAKHTPQDKKKKRSRSVDLSPLHSNLKKAPAGLTAKLSQCVEALGLKDALHRYHHNSDNADSSKDHEMDAVRSPNSKGHRVHFPTTMEALCQSCERPETTEEEKLLYHYTRHELMDMVLDAKESLARETHFCSQPEATIFEQGYLTFPNETHFFHHKRHYCLLKPRGELVCYSSPAHAAKNVHVRCRMSIIKVQECSTMSMQAKIAAFGAHLPSTLSLLFFVTKADGERVLLAAESRSSKKSWVHTLTRVTQVHESLPRCVLRQSSTASTCTSEDDGERAELNAQDLAVLDGETPECGETSKDSCKVASPCGVVLEESNNNCNDR